MAGKRHWRVAVDFWDLSGSLVPSDQPPAVPFPRCSQKEPVLLIFRVSGKVCCKFADSFVKAARNARREPGGSPPGSSNGFPRLRLHAVLQPQNLNTTSFTASRGLLGLRREQSAKLEKDLFETRGRTDPQIGGHLSFIVQREGTYC